MLPRTSLLLAVGNGDWCVPVPSRPAHLELVVNPAKFGLFRRELGVALLRDVWRREPSARSDRTYNHRMRAARCRPMIFIRRCEPHPRSA
jgi:hypothetical protein